MRVMMRIFTATYGLSDSSTPMWAMSEPRGPIENGTTYSVRPRMAPSNRPLSVSRMAAGSAQLLVGPASSARSEQMKVRSSTRATSEGSEHARKELGRLAGFSLRMVPDWTICSHSRSYSSWEPSHHTTWSGLASATKLATQSIRPRCFT